MVEKLFGATSLAPMLRRAALIAGIVALWGLGGCAIFAPEEVPRAGDNTPGTAAYKEAGQQAASRMVVEDERRHSEEHGGPGNNGQGGQQGGGQQTTSDMRLKRDLVEVGRLANGIHLYRFRYDWTEREYVGVMAQEVRKIVPGAVSTGPDGYLRVDYGKLGRRLETWDEWLREHPKAGLSAN
jgi:hypothetical protein